MPDVSLYLSPDCLLLRTTASCGSLCGIAGARRSPHPFCNQIYYEPFQVTVLFLPRFVMASAYTFFVAQVKRNVRLVTQQHIMYVIDLTLLPPPESD